MKEVFLKDNEIPLDIDCLINKENLLQLEKIKDDIENIKDMQNEIAEIIKKDGEILENVTSNIDNSSINIDHALNNIREVDNLNNYQISTLTILTGGLIGGILLGPVGGGILLGLKATGVIALSGAGIIIGGGSINSVRRKC